jgi:hypothetical protein
VLHFIIKLRRFFGFILHNSSFILAVPRLSRLFRAKVEGSLPGWFKILRFTRLRRVAFEVAVAVWVFRSTFNAQRSTFLRSAPQEGSKAV